MSDINLLLSIYFEEKSEEGLTTLRTLVSVAQDVQLTVFAGNRRHQSSGRDAITRISKPFNLAEGILRLRGYGPTDTRRLDVRYRPSISSRMWDALELSSDPAVLMRAASGAHSKEEVEDFQFLLSLRSFESTSRKSNTTGATVFEALHYSIPSADSVEKTILRSFESYPEMLKRKIWGYADIVPFRGLSLAEEWEAAIGCTLWNDLAVSQDAEHQYLFAAPDARPNIAVPPAGVHEGELTLYRLPPPRWTQTQ